MLGSKQDDVIRTGNTLLGVIVQAGSGNDIIIDANNSPDLIDGGKGNDTADYSETITLFGLSVDIGSNIDGVDRSLLTTKFTGTVEGRNPFVALDEDTIFNVEKIIGSRINDHFFVHDFQGSVKELDAFSGDSNLIDFSNVPQGILVDLDEGVVYSNSHEIYIQGFELIKGTRFNDIFKGGIETDTIVFSGSFDEYELAFDNALQTVEFTHLGGDRKDGTDTLDSSIEFARFRDRTVEISSLLDVNNEPQFNDFIGSDIQLVIFSPNLNSPLREPLIATVTDAIEFGDGPVALGSSGSIVGFTIDISADSIFYTVGESLSIDQFTSATFNGLVFTDIFDTAPDIENVTIDFSETTLGVNSADVSFSEDEIFLNVQGIPFTPGNTVKLDVDFAPQPIGFTGSEIQLEYLFPDLNTLVGDATTATVANGIEFSLASYDPDSTDGRFDPGYNIDITGSSIIFETVDSPLSNPYYVDADFNGIVFTDIFDTLPAIENVTIDTSVTNFGINASDITFTEDSIAIDFAGISYTPGETFKLDVTFDV